MNTDLARSIRLQNELTKSDLASRAASILLMTALCLYYVSWEHLVPFLSLYLILEVAGVATYRWMEETVGRLQIAVLLTLAFLGACAFTYVPLLMTTVDSEVARLIAIFSLITALFHTMMVRSSWIEFGVVTSIPLAIGLVYSVISLILDVGIGVEVFTGIAMFAVMLAYLGHGMSMMHRTRQRLMITSEEATQASEAKSRFIAAMSHEIRTPLNTIQGMAELFEDDPDPEQMRERVRMLQTASNTLKAIVDDILDHAKISAGAYSLRPIEASLASEVRTVVGLFNTAIEEKGLQLVVEIDPDMPERALFDPQRLRQVLSNLVSNAVKYTEKGTIAISATADREGEGWRARLSVSDTGRGLSEDEIDLLFKDFSRIEATAGTVQGTGLGLVISRAFARMMGGDVEVRSRLGVGSTFTATAFLTPVSAKSGQDRTPLSNQDLPAQGASAEADMQEEQDLGAHRREGRADGSSAQGEPELHTPQDAGDTEPLGLSSILLVDDNKSNRYLTRAYLKGLCLEIIEATNGKEALDELEKRVFDLVLLDMHMPVLDGPSTFARMRAAEGSMAEVPVITVTADAAEVDRDRYLALGMDGYVAKPVSKKRLISEISRVVRERKVSLAA